MGNLIRKLTTRLIFWTGFKLIKKENSLEAVNYIHSSLSRLDKKFEGYLLEAMTKEMIKDDLEKKRITIPKDGVLGQDDKGHGQYL